MVLAGEEMQATRSLVRKKKKNTPFNSFPDAVLPNRDLCLLVVLPWHSTTGESVTNIVIFALGVCEAVLVLIQTARTP